MNYITLINNDNVITISRLSAGSATYTFNYTVIHLYTKWWIIFNRERHMTRQIRMIVGQLIEQGWEVGHIGE
jgi:hypothetical protein